MAIATLPRSAARKRLWTFDGMVAELPETNLQVERSNAFVKLKSYGRS